MTNFATILSEAPTPQEILAGAPFPDEDQYHHWVAFATKGIHAATTSMAIVSKSRYKPLRDLQRVLMRFPSHDTADQMFIFIVRALNEHRLTEDYFLNKYAPEGFNQLCADHLMALRKAAETADLNGSKKQPTVRKHPPLNNPDAKA